MEMSEHTQPEIQLEYTLQPSVT